MWKISSSTHDCQGASHQHVCPILPSSTASLRNKKAHLLQHGNSVERSCDANPHRRIVEAKIIETALDVVHQTYIECTNKKDGDALASNLTSVKNTVNTMNTTVGGINSHTTSIGDNIVTKINTLSGKADTTNNAINSVGGNVTTINNTVNNINSKVDNISTNIDNSRTLIINNANLNAANSLRLLIEADLATADSSTPLAIFETPAAKGGYLELVRTIVFETIKNLTGATATQANATLASVDSLLAAGKYKAAYAALRKAYKSAAN